MSLANPSSKSSTTRTLTRSNLQRATSTGPEKKLAKNSFYQLAHKKQVSTSSFPTAAWFSRVSPKKLHSENLAQLTLKEPLGDKNFFKESFQKHSFQTALLQEHLCRAQLAEENFYNTSFPESSFTKETFSKTASRTAA